jgi:hypothetical protein
MAKQQEHRAPTYQAYTVIKREGQDDFWLNVGAAFEHADGKGLNVILQALPIDGKIVLRPPKDKDEHADDNERTKATVRQINDSRRGRDR